jgi:TPR repeat protein
MVKRFIAVVGIAVTLTCGAQAGPYESGYAAYFFGDYPKALRLLEPLADNADAQYTLGTMYHHGLGVSQDYTEAVKRYRFAADHHHAEAQYYLGIMYAQGWGVSQDRAEAVKWYQRAADQGFSRAQYNLGNAYFEGEGVPRDYVLAYVWLSLAAAAPAAGFEGIAEKERDQVAGYLNGDQMAEAKRLVQAWRPVAGAD